MSNKTINQLPVATSLQDTDEIVVSQGTGANDVKSSTLANLKTWMNADGIGLPVTANNGLTETGNNIQLGGTLLQNTTVDAGSNELKFQAENSSFSGAIDLQKGEVQITATNLTSNDNSFLDVTVDAASLQVNDGATGNYATFSAGGGTTSGNPVSVQMAVVSSLSGIKEISQNATDAGIAVTDSISSTGFLYAADYSTAGKTNDRWIPDYGAVKNLVASETISNTDGLAEGSTNLYFTAARVLSTILTGIGFSNATAVTATDSILQAFGKLQAQISALFKIPAGGTAGQVLAKVDNTDGNTQWTSFSYTNLSGSPVTDITYANLVSAIAASTLTRGNYYRITDYQTTHTIPATSVTNTGPVEPLIVQALSSNTIGSNAVSEEYPQDLIQYSVSNTYIAGATKGCILSRHDRVQNVKVSNDFRNVKYRRWRFVAPANFDSTVAIPQYTLVTAPDNGLYYCAKPGGFTAGAATTPSLTDDNWVQVFVNNNYYYARAGSGTAGVSITSNQNPSYTVPKFSINASDYVDTPIFPNYGTGFSNIDINNGPGNLMNLVFWNDNQASIVSNLVIGQYEYPSPIAYNSTFILTGSGKISSMQLTNGIAYSYVTATGNIYDWNSVHQVYSATINVSWINTCSFTPFYAVVRGTLYQVFGQRMEFMVTPMSMDNVFFPMGMGNLKFNTTANAFGWNVLNGLGSATIGSPSSFTVQSSTPDVVVDTAMSWRTFLGYADISSGGAHGSSADLSTQIAMAKTRLIVYDYEEPTGKSMIDITSGSARSVVWQTETPGVNLSSPSGYDNSSKAIRTYFTKHGNDFQVQQKDLISGVWTPNNSPAYTIDSVDTNGNVTSVTFTPNSSATESRFIIV